MGKFDYFTPPAPHLSHIILWLNLCSLSWVKLKLYISIHYDFAVLKYNQKKKIFCTATTTLPFLTLNLLLKPLKIVL